MQLRKRKGLGALAAIAMVATISPSTYAGPPVTEDIEAPRWYEIHPWVAGPAVFAGTLASSLSHPFRYAGDAALRTVGGDFGYATHVDTTETEAVQATMDYQGWSNSYATSTFRVGMSVSGLESGRIGFFGTDSMGGKDFDSVERWTHAASAVGTWASLSAGGLSKVGVNPVVVPKGIAVRYTVARAALITKVRPNFFPMSSEPAVSVGLSRGGPHVVVVESHGVARRSAQPRRHLLVRLRDVVARVQPGHQADVAAGHYHPPLSPRKFRAGAGAAGSSLEIFPQVEGAAYRPILTATVPPRLFGTYLARAAAIARRWHNRPYYGLKLRGIHNCVGYALDFYFLARSLQGVAFGQRYAFPLALASAVLPHTPSRQASDEASDEDGRRPELC